MSIHNVPPKHAVFASAPIWDRLQSLLCFAATLLRIHRSLYISFIDYERYKEAVIDLLDDFDLSADEVSRLRLIAIKAEESGAVIQEATKHLERLCRGEAINGELALPAPTVVLADRQVHSIVDRTRLIYSGATTLLYHAIDPGSINDEIHHLSRHSSVSAIRSIKSRLSLDSRRMKPASSSINEDAADARLLPRSLKGIAILNHVQEVHVAARQLIQSGHGIVIVWSRELSVKSFKTFQSYGREHSLPAIVLEPQMPPSFWEEPLFPEHDEAIKWLASGKTQSVVCISADEATAKSWHFDLLLESLAAAQMPTLITLPSSTAQEELIALTNKVGQLGRVTKLDRAVVLRHGAIGFFVSQGDATATLEALVCGLPIIFWSNDHQQAANAGLVTRDLDAGFEVLEARDWKGKLKLAKDSEATKTALRKQLDAIWTTCKGEVGRRKRQNAEKLGQLLRQEHRECSEQYAKELIALL